MSLVSPDSVRFSSSTNIGGGIYLSIRPSPLPPCSMHDQAASSRPLPTLAPRASPQHPHHLTKLPVLPASNPSPPHSDDGGCDNSIPAPITPPRHAVIPCDPNPLTPPLSSQCRNVLDLFRPTQPDASVLRRFLPPELPDEVDDLTPELLQKICQSLNLDPHVPHTVSCPLNKFQEWEEQNTEALKDLRGLWEYDAENALFIITSMPTAVHESLTSFIQFTVSLAIYSHIGCIRGVAVCANSEIRTVCLSGQSVRIPDICTKVHLHPLEDSKIRRSIVFEVGFTQTLRSLRDKARMWLYHTNEEVHLVVLIKLLEVPPARYITMAGETISRSRARKTQFEWPTSQLLFEGRTLEQEFHLRSSRNDVADRETSIEQILFDIRAATREYLLQADREGTLIPPLVEPIDATIYVYRRKEDNGDVSPVHNPLEKADTGDGIAGNQRGVVQGSLADGALEKDATGQGWRENSAGANWEDQALAEENEESERLGSGSRLEGGLELQSEEGSEQEDDAISKDGDETGLDLVCFTIAELYGPLPIPTCGTQLELCTTIIPPALLQTMPPSLHAHALKNITFPLTDFVEQIQESRSELARDRAFARADKIVDTAYSRWYDAVQAEETQAQMQKRKAVEMELREARKLGRKRKLEAALEEQED